MSSNETWRQEGRRAHGKEISRKMTKSWRRWDLKLTEEGDKHRINKEEEEDGIEPLGGPEIWLRKSDKSDSWRVCSILLSYCAHSEGLLTQLWRKIMAGGGRGWRRKAEYLEIIEGGLLCVTTLCFWLISTRRRDPCYESEKKPEPCSPPHPQHSHFSSTHLSHRHPASTSHHLSSPLLPSGWAVAGCGSSLLSFVFVDFHYVSLFVWLQSLTLLFLL